MVNFPGTAVGYEYLLHVIDPTHSCLEDQNFHNTPLLGVLNSIEVNIANLNVYLAFTYLGDSHRSILPSIGITVVRVGLLSATSTLNTRFHCHSYSMAPQSRSVYAMIVTLRLLPKPKGSVQFQKRLNSLILLLLRHRCTQKQHLLQRLQS